MTRFSLPTLPVKRLRAVVSDLRARSWFRPAFIASAIVAWLIVGAVGGPIFGKLSQEQTFDTATFLPQNAESTEEGAERAGFVQTDAVPAIFVLDHVTSPSQVAALQRFLDDAMELPLGEGPQTVGDIVTDDPFVFPAADGTAVAAVISVPPDVVFEQDGDDFVGIQVVDALRTGWDESGNEGELYLTGSLGIFADTFEVFLGIEDILLVAAMSVVLVILLIVYRSPVLPFMVLASAGLALTGAGLCLYALAKADTIDFNAQSQGIMSILVVGATTDYALLLVARYREELRRFASPYSAMKRAWRRSLAPITASAVTVMLCLLMLLFSRLSSNQSLGPVAAIGIGFALIAALTFLPALLLLGGTRARWVFWPKRPAFHPEDVNRMDSLAAVEVHVGIWGRVSKTVATHPRRTWVLAAAGLAVAAAFLPTLRASGIGDDDVFLNPTESIDGLAIYEEHFTAGESSPIEITAAESSWQDVAAAVQGVDGVTSAYPLTASVIAGVPSLEPEPPVVIDGRVAINAVAEVNSNSQEAKNLIRVVRDAVHEVDPSALVGGTAAVNLDVNLTTDRDLTVIVPLVLAVILIVLTILLRSLVAPLVIVAANVLSFAATLGVSAIVFNHVLHHPGSDSVVPLFGFVFLVALGVDYSIFLMSRGREEALQRGTREGIRRSLAVTGGVITSAGIVLAATFGALSVLPILFMVQLAFIVAAGVLIDTLVVRTLLLPGLIHELGRASWWPWVGKIRD